MKLFVTEWEYIRLGSMGVMVPFDAHEAECVREQTLAIFYGWA